jgi:hypothetical protein
VRVWYGSRGEASLSLPLCRFGARAPMAFAPPNPRLQKLSSRYHLVAVSHR